jgi:signal transduction histidine kinase/DNA-binding response OmpR family regulator/ligand-binding sensor domain-containing protein
MLIILLACYISLVDAIAQQLPSEAERGNLFIRNYSPKEYSAHVQNWAGIQDRRGIMYFANSSGILEYDGVNWRLLQTEKSTHVRSLDIDEKGKIYVGAYGELGYLAYDALGQAYFSSLTHKLDTTFRDFLDIWKTFCKKDGVYFSSYKYLFRWSPDPDRENEGSFKVWKSSSHFQFAFSIGERFFIQQRRVGLMELVGDSLKLIGGGDLFKDSWVFAMMERHDGKVLIVDRTHGLYMYANGMLEKLHTRSEEQILESRVFHGISLPDGNVALATNLSGILILNKEGELVGRINVEAGLQNESVTSLYLDREAGLWATLSNGIDRIELNSPFSKFDKLQGESNSIASITRHHGKIYFASGTGVYVLENGINVSDNGTSNVRPEKVEGITTQCWSFASVGNTLLIGTSNGLFSFDHNRAKLVGEGHFRSLLRSRRDSTLVFAGKERSLVLLSVSEGKVTEKHKHTGLVGEIVFIEEDQHGYIWGSTVYNGIYRFKVDSTGLVVASEHLGLDQGLPTLINNTARMVGGRLLVSTQRGIYTFNDRTRRFDIDASFGAELQKAEVQHLLTDHKNVVWIHGYHQGRRLVGYNLSNGPDTIWITNPFNRFIDYRVYAIYPDSGGVVWFGGPDGVIRYDINVKKDYKYQYQALITKVLINQDSLLYAGSALTGEAPAIDYTYNALRFEFSAPSYDYESSNRYSYFLENFDQDWSDWTNETKKDYTNLPEGNYRLRVKAENIYRNVSQEDTFVFSILPPWYRSWWAFLLYLITGGSVLIALVQWRSRQIRRENQAMEQIILERTQEVATQADKLRLQAEKLQELDRAKSNFFANISHEFRTPLTLIAGCLEDLAVNAATNEHRSHVEVMRKNTKRLRQLIEQLLDLSKLESGKLKLNVRPTNPYALVNAIISSFSSWAGQKNITLVVDIRENSIQAYLDEDVLEKVLGNIVSNAVKFTQANGQVSISANWNVEELTIRISDNGQGIPPDMIDRIFERFYQIDDSNTRNQEGSGIGLALVKELVSLHHGQIKVESKQGEGTSFQITIPIQMKNYAQFEIAQYPKEDTGVSSSEVEANLAETYTEELEPAIESPMLLIVEDNIDLSHFIGSHLPDYSIILAGNGVDGLKKAIQHIPDLIISDVMMPEMDGVELCKKLKEEEKTSHIPVILLTAKADIESRLEGLETGADDYITKPFDARELQIRVKNLIHQRELLRARFSRTVILKPKDIAITSPDEVFLEKVMAIIEDHLSDSQFDVEDFQIAIGMSRMQLHRKLKALTGHSTGEFVRIQRLIRASEMLSKTDDNISEVCYHTGFTSLSYFAKCFKKQFGTTPKDYALKYSQIR